MACWPGLKVLGDQGRARLCSLVPVRAMSNDLNDDWLNDWGVLYDFLVADAGKGSDPAKELLDIIFGRGNWSPEQQRKIRHTIEGSDGSGKKEKGPLIPDTSWEQGNEDQKFGNDFRGNEDQGKGRGFQGNDEQSKGFKGYEDTGKGSNGSSDRWWGNGWQGYYENSRKGSFTDYDDPLMNGFFEDIGRAVYAQWLANNMSFEPGMGRQMYTNPGKGRNGYKDCSKGMKGYEYPSKGCKGLDTGKGFRRYDGSGKSMKGYEDLGPGKGWPGYDDYEVQGKGWKGWMKSSASRLGPYQKW